MDIPILPLQKLSDRHSGLTPEIASNYEQAARVCLDRNHESPIQFTLEADSSTSLIVIEWITTDHRTKRAWANSDDATRDGAYAVALAATEIGNGMVAVARAESLTGADYYVAPIDNVGEDLEDWFKLEVSGTDLNEPQVRYRLNSKIDQVRKGKGNLPALAAVVGFKVKQILIKTVNQL